MRYFESRSTAGIVLAEQIAVKHANENCAVVALTEGAVLVGEQIAKHLHGTLYLLATKDITMPRENQPVATMSSAGTFTYNSELSAGQLEEILDDYRNAIDQERFRTFQSLNRIIGKDGAIKKEFLRRHTVILVSDGFTNGLSLDVAADFLKPIDVKRLIVATPVATVKAIDRMHILADEIFCLSTPENFFTVDHYYEQNTIPDHATVVKIMKNIVLNW